MAESQIQMFMHCVLCMREKPGDIAPRDWAQLECGWTARGFQVWCRRHACSIVHVDFEGVQHPADTTQGGAFDDEPETIQ